VAEVRVRSGVTAVIWRIIKYKHADEFAVFTRRYSYNTRLRDTSGMW
jgi:hypothetical protein